MISYLSGKIIVKKDNFVILEVNGVGWEVLVAQKIFEGLPQTGGALSLFCQMEANERGVKLFGVLSFEQLDLFKIIRSIQGVGPRAALEISAFGSLEKLKNSIEKGDVKIFEDLPNIGKKKAQKILLELSGKIRVLEPKLKKEKDFFEQDEAFLALLNLGFSKDRAMNALLELPKEIKDPQEKIKQALKIVGRR